MPTETSADLTSLLLVFVAVAAAPIIAGASRRVLIPTVVVEVFLGILIGPDVLDLAEVDEFINFLSQIGLAFLFFLAGLEIELTAVRPPQAVRASLGWLLSIAIGLSVATLMFWSGGKRDIVFVGIAVATTALGVLTPILRDGGLTGTPLGAFASAAGIAGELFPIIVIAVFLSSTESSAHEIAVLLVFLAISLYLARLVLTARPPLVVRTIAETMHRSGQLAVRLSVLTLIALVWLTVELDIDYILGALAAGLVVGLVARGEVGTVVRERIEGVGYGLFVPLFMVVSGMRFDLDALLGSAAAMSLVPLAALLILAARGAPAVLLYRGALDRRGRAVLAFLSATTLPLVIAITEIGVASGDMARDDAAGLVGAAMISVLLFPALGLALHRARPGEDPGEDRASASTSAFRR
jgi:Kef-type K+ transport system membrane component KefB